MTKKNKLSSERPDEVFSVGPLTIARYGPNIHWQADWEDNALEEFQDQQISIYPQIVNAIDTLVSDIATLVAVLPPKVLLHRAWTEMAARHIRLDTETKVDDDDAINLRMLDYVQSVIASVPPSKCQRQEITDEDWSTLREKVEALFHTLNISYQICRTAKNRREDPNYDVHVEEFYYKAQMYWCNVRGKRYQVHEPEYVRQMFLPHSDVLLELFGITGVQFADQLANIWHSLSFGIEDVIDSIGNFREDILHVPERMTDDPEAHADADIERFIQRVIEDNNWQQRRDDIAGRLHGTDLFDLQKRPIFQKPFSRNLLGLPEKMRHFSLRAIIPAGPSVSGQFSSDRLFGWTVDTTVSIYIIFSTTYIVLCSASFCA